MSGKPLSNYLVHLLCRWIVPVLAVGLSISVLQPTADAAEITDVVDAFDEADVFDFHLEPRFEQHIQRGTVIREAPCTPDPNGPPEAFQNAEKCPDEATVIFTRELDYERIVSALDVDFQFGIWQDLEFHFTLPIIISDTRALKFAAGDGPRNVSQANSSVDPTDELITDDLDNGGLFSTYRFFSIGNELVGPDRSGLGDLIFGFAWSPFNQERSPHLATLRLAFDYLAPTADPAMRTNSSVGRGVHEFIFNISASRRYAIVEPYFGVTYILPRPSADSLFQHHGGGQTTVGPGQRAEITGGAELILFESVPREQLFTFDIGFTFGFTAEGRDYSPISDALSGSACNGITPGEAGYTLDGSPFEPPSNTPINDAACGWIVQEPANRYPNPGADESEQQYYHDGITSVESYGTMGAHFGLNFQISPYVEIRVATDIETETEHFLTAARTGRDRDGDDEVDFNNPNERSPVYNPTLDGVGRRLRVESVFNVDWNAVIAFQF